VGNAATIDAFVKDESKDGLAAPRRCLSNGLVWNAVAIVLGLGALTTVVALLADPHLYAAMGGRGASLAAALAYSDVVFAGAVLLWLFNALAAVVRGTGNMLLPAGVMCAGTAALIPLSPALIFGVGPLPRLGVVGGAVAVLAYYVAGIVVFAAASALGGMAPRAPRRRFAVVPSTTPKARAVPPNLRAPSPPAWSSSV
jgi:hypothetical protein